MRGCRPPTILILRGMTFVRPPWRTSTCFKVLASRKARREDTTASYCILSLMSASLPTNQDCDGTSNFRYSATHLPHPSSLRTSGQAHSLAEYSSPSLRPSLHFQHRQARLPSATREFCVVGHSVAVHPVIFGNAFTRGRGVVRTSIPDGLECPSAFAALRFWTRLADAGDEAYSDVDCPGRWGAAGRGCGGSGWTLLDWEGLPMWSRTMFSFVAGRSVQASMLFAPAASSTQATSTSALFQARRFSACPIVDAGSFKRTYPSERYGVGIPKSSVPHHAKKAIVSAGSYPSRSDSTLRLAHLPRDNNVRIRPRSSDQTSSRLGSFITRHRRRCQNAKPSTRASPPSCSTGRVGNRKSVGTGAEG
ncbi:hypothetical protein C8F01DRAFT_1375110 [Mycena amicta]|nr:hypothetical protein C8F01DRAFT_1375110 [Mycena amicta]